MVRWTGVPTAGQLQALNAAHRAARATGREVLLINDVMQLAGSVRVEAGVHAHMIDLVTEGRAHTRAVAHVVEVPGAFGAAVRTFLRGLERVAGDERTSTRTFERVEGAAAWLSGIDPTWHPVDLARSLGAITSGDVALSLAA